MFVKLSFVVYICIIVSLAHANSDDVLVNNLKLFVDGKEFFIKAMCYHPVPLGWHKMSSSGGDGGGYCSPKKTAYGDWKSACYDSDFFDAGSNPAGSVPPGPSQWFKAIWERDFPYMKQLGTNTLRIYNANPTTLQASLQASNNIPNPLGKNHIPFMDMAHSYGFKVIFPLFGDNTMLSTLDPAVIQQYLRWQIDEIGNHPALLMLTFGNELDLYNNAALITLVNNNIAYARNYMKTKWNRKVPITTAIVDLPDSYNSLFRDLDVDVFTTNAGYRGFDFSDLWSGSSSSRGLYKLSCETGKPVFIGEIGWLSLNAAINAISPDWFNRVWKDLVGHIDQGCIGGAFFEYSDEPYTKVDPLQQHMGVVTLSVTQNSDQLNVFVPDAVTPREYLYDAVANGTYQGLPYNMNADPFVLIGRSPVTIDSAPLSICGANSVATASSGLPTGSGTGYSASTGGSATTGASTPTTTPKPTQNPSTPTSTMDPSTPTSTMDPSTPTSSPSETPSGSTGLDQDHTGHDSAAVVTRPALIMTIALSAVLCAVAYL